MEGKNLKELTAEASLDNVLTITEFINEELEEARCPLKARLQIDIAIDEIVSNIAKYAYGGRSGKVKVTIDISSSPPGAEITFTDSGVPFNPLAMKDPDVTLSSADRKIGGLGIFMVKKTMDEVLYEYKDGCNILTVRKEF